MEVLIILFLLLNNGIVKLFPNVEFLSYWDELSFLFICLILLFYTIKMGIKKEDKQYILIILGVTVIGLIGNFIYEYQNSISAIIRDLVGFLKFPLSLFAFYKLNLVNRFVRKFVKLIRIFKLLVWIVFIFGIVSIFWNIGMNLSEFRYGIHPYMFIFKHPTYLTTSLIMLICLLNAYEETSILYDILLIVPIVLGMRTRGFAFVAVYIFVKYGGNWLKRFKAMYWILIGMVVLMVSYSKLARYASYSSSPRETLYLGAFRIFQLCFPIGSGFATFASHISGRYFSNVYNFISISGLYNYDGTIADAIGDAGFPYYIGQFGLIGCVLIAFLFINLYKLSVRAIPKAKRTPVVLMWLMIVISLTSETLLVNDGFQIAFIMSIISRLLSLKYSGEKNETEKTFPTTNNSKISLHNNYAKIV